MFGSYTLTLQKHLPTFPVLWAGNLFERRDKINPADISLSTTGQSPVKGDDNRTAPDVNSTLACESVPATARALAMDLYIHDTVHAFAVQPVVLGLPRSYRTCFSHGPVYMHVYSLCFSCATCGTGPAVYLPHVPWPWTCI